MSLFKNLVRELERCPVNTDGVECTDVVVNFPGLVWVDMLALHEPPATQYQCHRISPANSTHKSPLLYLSQAADWEKYGG